VSSIRRRYKSTLSIVVGIALFVFVLSMVQMLRVGIHHTMVRASDPDVLVVMSTGAGNEMSSYISPAQVDQLLALPSAGVKDALREFVILKLFETADHGSGGNVLIRGVPANVFQFRKGAHLVEGRMPRPGQREVLVGQNASPRFANMKVGDTLELAFGQSVKVVGVFGYTNSSFESEIWGDLDMIRSFFSREGVISSLRLRVDPARMRAFIAEAHRSGLPLRLVPEPDFTREQAAKPKQFISTIGGLIGILIALASVIAVATVMRTSIDGRHNEIVLLRKMGFSARAVVAAFFREAALLGLLGGVLGLGLSLLLTSMRVTIMSVSTWSQLIVGFDITGEVVLVSLIAGLLAAVLGAAVPTLRTARFFYVRN
jgi:putative ABC transport system permease protein